LNWVQLKTLNRPKEMHSFPLACYFPVFKCFKKSTFLHKYPDPVCKNIFHCSYSDSRPNKTFSPCCSSCVGANKMLGSGSQETDPEPQGFTLQTGYSCNTGLHQKGLHRNLIHHLCKFLFLVWNKN
jgi:hypothetical protein